MSEGFWMQQDRNHGFSGMQKESKKHGELIVLRKHRSSLLERLHKSQKQIDCLDYLIYQIEQEEQSNNRNQQDSR